MAPSRELMLLRPPRFPTSCFLSGLAASLLPIVSCRCRPRPRTRTRPPRFTSDVRLRPRCGLKEDGEADLDDLWELLLLHSADKWVVNYSGKHCNGNSATGSTCELAEFHLTQHTTGHIVDEPFHLYWHGNSKQPTEEIHRKLHLTVNL